MFSSLSSRLTGRAVFFAGRLVAGDLVRTARRPRRWPEPEVCGPATVVVVDDPEHDTDHGTARGRIVAAAGPVDDRLIERLRLAVDDLSTGSSAHLDLTAVDIPDPVAMRRLEAVIDRLEVLGVIVRVVGIDPSHPALA